MSHLVSIIIPTFNRSTLLGATLQSVVDQEYLNWECIVIDDGSEDDTKSIAQTFVTRDPRFQLHSRPSNRLKGANACRNYGFEISKGIYVNWFDSDDIMDVAFISKKVAALSDVTLDAAISKKADFIESPQIISKRELRTFLSSDILTDFLNTTISWYLPDVMWRRNFLNRKLLFDENLLAGQDRDFHARMLLHNPKLAIVDSYLTFCRDHPNNITSKVNSIKSKNLKVSHLHSVVKLMNLLENSGKLKPSIKVRYFKSMMRYLPFVIANKSDTVVLFQLLKKLSFCNSRIVLGWIQFFFAYFSLRIFGRGERLLK